VPKGSESLCRTGTTVGFGFFVLPFPLNVLSTGARGSIHSEDVAIIRIKIYIIGRRLHTLELIVVHRVFPSMW